MTDEMKNEEGSGELQGSVAASAATHGRLGEPSAEVSAEAQPTESANSPETPAASAAHSSPEASNASASPESPNEEQAHASDDRISPATASGAEEASETSAAPRIKRRNRIAAGIAAAALAVAVAAGVGYASGAFGGNGNGSGAQDAAVTASQSAASGQGASSEENRSQTAEQAKADSNSQAAESAKTNADQAQQQQQAADQQTQTEASASAASESPAVNDPAGANANAFAPTQSDSANSTSHESSQQAASTISVYISVDSSRAAEYGLSGPSAGTTVELSAGATVYDALCALGCSLSGSSTYVSAIGGLAEKQCGNGSGWTYAVNGEFPGKACGRYTLTGGESISWIYSTEKNPTISM